MPHPIKLVLAVAGLLAAAPAAAKQPPEKAQAEAQTRAEAQAQEQQVKSFMASLHPVSGDVAIPKADAVLHLGKDYYFLPPDDARRVLVDAWGNPASVAEGVLGMVLPAGKTVADDTWGAVITWEPLGFVKDDDAKSADYDQIASDMQAGEEEINARRKKEGFPAQHFVGWAQPPSYDSLHHSVVWAQNIAFEGQSENSLNYDVRLLGRRGVLSLNLIYGMSKLAETRAAAQAFARSAEFTPGARYADYKPGVDTDAGIGIGGLVAAGVGVAAAKKFGLLALILAFGKKFLILIAALAAGFRKRLARLFGFGKDELEGTEEYDHSAYEAAPASESDPAPEGDAVTAADTEDDPVER